MLLKRRLDIADIVREKGEVKVDELSELLNVSGVTIRQDLNYLEQQGYLKRSFGGAIYVAPEHGIHTKVSNTQLTNSVENNDIELVLACLDLINDDDTLFLGHGNLLRKLIPYLYNKKNLTIIVNDISHVVLAKEFTQAEVLVIGGMISEHNVIIYNKELDSVLKNHPVSLFITEVNAISPENELIIQDSGLMGSYQLLLKNAHKSVIVLPQRMSHNEVNSIGLLEHIDTAILSRSAMTEYHQQLLDCQFKQSLTNKKSVVYQKIQG
ncbi:DeoR/GlpR family DNA-binding transcription regulator [Zophobihabitans entericus]